MFNFFKTLFRYRRKDITVILWEDGAPDEPNTGHFRPGLFFVTLILAVVLPLISLIVVFKYTPAGMIVLNYEDHLLRNELILVNERFMALQDSLNNRDQQMAGLREVIRTRIDTVFQAGATRDFINTSELNISNITPINPAGVFSFLSNPEISFGGSVLSEPSFPVPAPAKGIVSQNFQPVAGHFGLDIAAREGEIIRSIADGVILSADWTVNYGNVIVIQHLSGYVSVYKHTHTPNRKTGDFVKKGDILSSVSNTGLTSSGPHLHFELWRNGLPIDPQNLITD